MNTISESRFLPSFLAIVASIVLVCGGLLLLTSTAPWTSRDEAAGDAVARSADGAVEPTPPAEIVIAPSTSAGSSLAGADTAEAGRGESTHAAEAPTAEPQEAAPEHVQTAMSDPPSAPAEDSAASDGPHADEAEASASASDVPQVDEAEAGASDVPQVDEVEGGASDAIATESMIVSDAEPMAENTVEPGTVLHTAPANTEAAETPVATEAPAANDQIGELLAERAPQAVAVETIGEDTGEAAGKVAAPQPAKTTGSAAPRTSAEVSAATPQQPAKTTDSAGPEASAEVSAATPLPPPPPPAPKRKPEIGTKVPAQTARTTARPERPSRPEALKQGQSRPAVAQQTPAQTRPGAGWWLPMALAPADKAVTKQPAARLSGAAYSSKVWSALARRKPRAGQSGSATVMFTIGASGALGGVRIGQSSGNSRIDQLALATVRGAAPFPPPPSGPASFSIRIDFH